MKTGGHLQNFMLRHPKNRYSASHLNYGWKRWVGKEEDKIQEGMIKQIPCSWEDKTPTLKIDTVQCHLKCCILYQQQIKNYVLYKNKEDNWFWYKTPSYNNYLSTLSNCNSISPSHVLFPFNSVWNQFFSDRSKSTLLQAFFWHQEMEEGYQVN